MDIVQAFKLRNGLKEQDNYFLGELCKHGHDWDGTGQSLRRKADNRVCLVCEKLTKGIRPTLTAEERFWSKVDKSGDCWEWQAGKYSTGYGRFDAKGLPMPAHRTAWVLTHGEIPEGYQVCHVCDNPPCCRVSHLFLGTPTDNAQDMIAKGRKNSALGEQSGNSKLTETEVKEIRRLYFSKELGVVAIAKRFGVTRVNIRAIVAGKTWRHIL